MTTKDMNRDIEPRSEMLIPGDVVFHDEAFYDFTGGVLGAKKDAEFHAKWQDLAGAFPVPIMVEPETEANGQEYVDSAVTNAGALATQEKTPRVPERQTLGEHVNDKVYNQIESDINHQEIILEQLAENIRNHDSVLVDLSSESMNLDAEYRRAKTELDRRIKSEQEARTESITSRIETIDRIDQLRQMKHLADMTRLRRMHR